MTDTITPEEVAGLAKERDGATYLLDSGDHTAVERLFRAGEMLRYRAPAMARLVATQAAEIERLRGLLWYAWHEFNAIRARSGAPLCQYGMTTVSVEHWDALTKAFREALPEADRMPWPSEAARAALEQEGG